MKKTGKRIGPGLLCPAAPAPAVFAGTYASGIRTVASVRKLTDYADGYNLYPVSAAYDYSAAEKPGYEFDREYTAFEAAEK